ncbi:S1/P1 nuclease [Hirschia baltica]|uniref:S1/P1 nuclease n=1 Tax=Hirschia baltica (strain ATCC 49814 / DSM 5838 / IFAM 1418) TaxID=582402 RepID=C6XIU0_HIRBI|nr:S1/P1 nuclease [Hirschia baltica]ACT59035.1 S1/P1 nuclease [Hirschia baltica ATCC 49814]
MRLLISAAISACIAASSFSLPAHAWGKLGHRVTGEIAEGYLSDQAKVAVEAILGVEDMAEVSTWPDYMRSSDDEFFKREAFPLHFVTVPDEQTYAEAGAPKQGDAFTGLERFKAVLQNNESSAEELRLALIMVIHIVSDLHQPLHVGKGDDWGGNKVEIMFKGEASNLHEIWDEKLVQDEELSYTEMAHWLDRKMTPELAQEWYNADPSVWIAESKEIRPSIYPKDGETDLSWQYIYDHRPVMRQRLSQSGVRLAAYLNEIFGE